VPDFIPLVSGLQVAGIFPVLHFTGALVKFNLPPGGKKKGPDDISASGRDPFQPPDSCAPCHVQEESFNGIIFIVGGCHTIKRVFQKQLFKPLVTQIPGSHLHGMATRLHLPLHIETFHKNWDSQGTGQVPDECFIHFGIISAELKIAVGNGTPVSRFYEKVEHDHRIDSATYGKKDPVIGTAKFMFSYKILERLEHHFHKLQKRAVTLV
jgi:hypothetical protein